MAFKVIITPPAKRSLEHFIQYTAYVLHNHQATRAIFEDSKETIKRLSANAEIYAYCADPDLAAFGYRKIWIKKHDFFMIY